MSEGPEEPKYSAQDRIRHAFYDISRARRGIKAAVDRVEAANSSLVEARREVERLEAENARLTRKVDRLEATLLLIDGGDIPSNDPEYLRRLAYEALTLGRDHAVGELGCSG